MDVRETVTMQLADENAKSTKEKAIFVENLGILLSQTSKGVYSCRLKGSDTVVVTFIDRFTKEIRVDTDSFLAITRDVVMHLSH